MKVSILTLGCKANQAESLDVESYLRSAGYSIVDLSQEPDFCIINTCTVTAKSDYQSRQLIRRAVRTGSKVIVTGCYSEIKKEEVNAFKGVFKVVPNGQKDLIIKELAQNLSTNTLDYSSGRSRFFLKIQDGCNYSCSYCIIPRARGRSRSIAPEKIIDRIREISHYFKEVVLTGIHIGTYGYDLKPKLKLSGLIESILKETSIRRVRISSLEINEIDDHMIDLISDSRICKHLHIPLQSGDNKILKLMKRNYKIDDFLKVFYKIIKNYPDISIGTDIIVGFPGEGEREFNNTKEIVMNLPFTYLHVFPYSPRSGTEASLMRPLIREDIKKQRAAIIRQLGTQKRFNYMRAQIGKTLDVLIEKRVDNEYIGLSSNYLRVKTLSENLPLREIVNVRVSEVFENEIFGHVVRNL